MNKLEWFFADFSICRWYPIIFHGRLLFKGIINKKKMRANYDNLFCYQGHFIHRGFKDQDGWKINWDSRRRFSRLLGAVEYIDSKLAQLDAEEGVYAESIPQEGGRNGGSTSIIQG